MKFIFQLTYDCNLRCKYCYQPKIVHNKKLTKEDAFLLIDEYFLYLTTGKSKIFSTYVSDDLEQWKQDTLLIDFFGGECLLHTNLIIEILDYFHDNFIKYNYEDIWNNGQISIETNGTLIQTKAVNRLLEKYKEKLEWGITFEGTKEAHDINRRDINDNGTYDIVVENIQYLKDYYAKYNLVPKLTTKLTFNQNNVNLILPMIQGLVKLGYRGCQAGYDVTQQLTIEDTENYYKNLCKVIDWIVDNNIRFYMTQPFGQKYINEFETPSCGTNGTQLCIGPGGILSPCQQTNESFLDNKFTLGNVRDGIINLDVLDLFRTRRANILVPKQCIDCPIVRCCSDCPMLCYTSTGDIHKRIGGCGENVAHARAQLYLLKKMEENPDYPYYQRTKQHIKDTNKYDPNFHYLYLDNYEYDWVPYYDKIEFTPIVEKEPE